MSAEPEHNDEGEAFALTDVGTLLTVTDEVVAAADPQALLAVTVNTPPLEALTAKADGFCELEE